MRERTFGRTAARTLAPLLLGRVAVRSALVRPREERGAVDRVR